MKERNGVSFQQRKNNVTLGRDVKRRYGGGDEEEPRGKPRGEYRGYFVIKQDRVCEALIHRLALRPKCFAIKRQSLQPRRDVERINEKKE